MTAWMGGRSADDGDDDRPFDSAPGLDDALWRDGQTVHRAECRAHTITATRYIAPTDHDQPCPTCLPEGLP